MTKRALTLIAVLTTIALAAVSCGGDTNSDSTSATTTAPADAGSGDGDATGDRTENVACPTEGEEWEVAKLYIEHNATDEDTGVHGLFGGEAWAELCIEDPDGNLILLADPQAQLGDLTVSDLFFESREPPGDEYSVADLQADFPEGGYRVSGTDFEGTPRSGTAQFSHMIPAPPEILAPTLVDEPEATDEATVPAEELTVDWREVTETIGGEPVAITGYEVIVTQEDFDDPNGLSQPIYDVHVPADRRSLAVPSSFLDSGTVYELEVLALEETGNQTITVGFFRIASADTA